MKTLDRIMSDFVMYMDTSVPKGINPTFWTQLKYSNRQKIDKFTDEYKIPRELIRKIAEYEFMLQDTETILRKCDIFIEGEKDEKIKNKKNSQTNEQKSR